MTKEDILELRYSEGSYLPDERNFPTSEVIIAMDQYAMHQAINYAHWCFKKIYPGLSEEPPMAEAEVLYSQFTQSR